jgi:glycosyltransferase involved in cell wall biosynthesis
MCGVIWKIFASEIIKEECDAVLCINPTTLPVALRLLKKTAIPVIYETYEFFPAMIGGGFYGYGDWSERKRKRVLRDERLVMQKAAASICVAETISKRYEKLYEIDSPRVIHNVVMPDAIDPTPVHSPLRFYFQSGLRPNYGIEEIVAACAKTTGNFHLTVQGRECVEGYNDELIDYVKQMGIEQRFTLADSCPYENIVVEANQHDVGICALPTTVNGRFEENSFLTLPNKVFAYANAGLAFAMGRFPSIQAIAHDKFCRWFDIDDIDDMARALQWMIDHPDEVQAMKQAASLWSSNYSFDAESTRIAAVYAQACCAPLLEGDEKP